MPSDVADLVGALLVLGANSMLKPSLPAGLAPFSNPKSPKPYLQHLCLEAQCKIQSCLRSKGLVPCLNLSSDGFPAARYIWVVLDN